MSSEEPFGATIRHLREGQGLTQEDMDRLSEGELTQTYVSLVERGRVVRPSTGKIALFAKVLKADYNWLMVRAGYMKENPDTTVTEPGISEIERDLLSFAEDRPDLLVVLREIRDQNTDEEYATALRIIHRSLISGIETARDVVGRQRG